MENLQAAAFFTFQTQIASLVTIWPYLKSAFDIFYLILQICLLLTQFAIGWIIEIAFESSTLDVLIFIISFGITTKILMDAANIEISIHWRI
ncbi:unnamed protein product [Caenorhabditis angaria]|uniref:Uncharacterized protein n=1 Tax=Caenorhabditis angaria TaxID=860376 RepID=A0A9P1N5Y3_9PELO|nr:unnamed protein product [Caenorhabditis angaria]